MKILYFAWVRERLGKGEEEVTPPSHVETVADLVGWLRDRDDSGATAFARPEIIRAAIDAKAVKQGASIRGATIVALFPPMTGG